MKREFGPSQLTTIGVIGTACFVAAAVIGTILKSAGPSVAPAPSNIVVVNPPPPPTAQAPPPAAPPAKTVEPAAPPARTPETAASPTRTVEPATPSAKVPELAAPPAKAAEVAPPPSPQEPVRDIVEFLDGPFSDLLHETELLLADFDGEVANDPKAIVVRLRDLTRRTQATLAEFSMLLGKPVADGRDRIDAAPLTHFGSSLVALVHAVQALKEDDQEGYRNLINDPARARFNSAAGGLASWIAQTRTAMGGS